VVGLLYALADAEREMLAFFDAVGFVFLSLAPPPFFFQHRRRTATWFFVFVHDGLAVGTLPPFFPWHSTLPLFASKSDPLFPGCGGRGGIEPFHNPRAGLSPSSRKDECSAFCFPPCFPFQAKRFTAQSDNDMAGSPLKIGSGYPYFFFGIPVR